MVFPFTSVILMKNQSISDFTCFNVQRLLIEAEGIHRSIFVHRIILLNIRWYSLLENQRISTLLNTQVRTTEVVTGAPAKNRSKNEGILISQTLTISHIK